MKSRHSFVPLLLRWLAVAAPALPVAPAGGPGEPVRYVGQETVDGTHEGGLRLAVGVKSGQAFRTNRAHPGQAEGFGWTRNHAPLGRSAVVR
jgi:hypothetical protein